MTTVDGKTFLPSEPIFSYVFPFEENLSPDRARQWMKRNNSSVYFLCGIYIFLIFSMQFYMRNKPRYNLRRALAIWNAGLAIFSIFGALRSIPELYHMWINNSLYDSICYPAVLEPIKVTEFWSWLFALSKIPELGDTMFIVLRKNPLRFLHWFHHVVTLLYIWSAFAENAAYSRWFKTMNYSVHSLMYSYYTFRALGYTAPKFVMISITFLQVVQMAIGCSVAGLAYSYHLSDLPCHVTNWDIIVSGSMYFTYLILFSTLFYEMYLKPSKKQYSTIADHANVKRK